MHSIFIYDEFKERSQRLLRMLYESCKAKCAHAKICHGSQVKRNSILNFPVDFNCQLLRLCLSHQTTKSLWWIFSTLLSIDFARTKRKANQIIWVNRWNIATINHHFHAAWRIESRRTLFNRLADILLFSLRTEDKMRSELWNAVFNLPI